MKAILVIIALILVVTLTVQVSTMYKAKGDLENRVEYRLDFVDEASIESVKRDLIADAEKLGIQLSPAKIGILYQDTDQLQFAQKIVGGKLGAQFHNKQVGINVEYDAHILGLPVHQRVTATKIKQVAAPSLPPRDAAQELLDSTP